MLESAKGDLNLTKFCRISDLFRSSGDAVRTGSCFLSMGLETSSAEYLCQIDIEQEPPSDSTRGSDTPSIK